MIYLDNAATTKPYNDVTNIMAKVNEEFWANPSSTHHEGQKVLNLIDEARESIAKIINAKPKEIYFTSGGSEGDNFVLKGLAFAKNNSKKTIITSTIEHHAIIETCKDLERLGFNIIYLKPNTNGIITPELLKSAINDDVFLVSIMYVNNEVGVIQPIDEYIKICHENNILFHSDMVQAVPYLDIDVKKLDVDLITVSAHKFHGPKGIGFVYIKDNIKINNLIFGGNQERGKRAGTLNTPAILGLNTAFYLTEQNRNDDFKKVSKLRDYFEKEILNNFSFAKINCGNELRSPSISNVYFEGFLSSNIVVYLDLNNVCVSSGPACTAGSEQPSTVITSIYDENRAKSSVRFSFSSDNTIEEIDKVIALLKEFFN